MKWGYNIISFNPRAVYGDVLGLFLGPNPGVVVMGWGPVTAALQNPLLNGRPVQLNIIDRFGDKKGDKKQHY